MTSVQANRTRTWFDINITEFCRLGSESSTKGLRLDSSKAFRYLHYSLAIFQSLSSFLDLEHLQCNTNPQICDQTNNLRIIYHFSVFQAVLPESLETLTPDLPPNTPDFPPAPKIH